MNNKFDWNRFCKVVSKDFHNIWPLYGPTLLIITLLPMAMWLLAWVFSGTQGFDIPPVWRVAIILTLADLAALMTPSRLYRTMNLRNEGIYFAMLPASKLEKFLSILIFTLIVCPLMVLVGGIVLDMVLYLLPFGNYHQSLFSVGINEAYWQMVGTIFPKGMEPLVCVVNLLSTMAGTLLFLFTATIFTRHKVLQTFLWCWLVGFVLSLIGGPVLLHLASNGQFDTWMEWIANSGIDEKTFAGWVLAIVGVVNAAIAALLLWLTWRRLKRMPY